MNLPLMYLPVTLRFNYFISENIPNAAQLSAPKRFGTKEEHKLGAS